MIPHLIHAAHYLTSVGLPVDLDGHTVMTQATTQLHESLINGQRVHRVQIRIESIHPGFMRAYAGGIARLRKGNQKALWITLAAAQERFADLRPQLRSKSKVEEFGSLGAVLAAESMFMASSGDLEIATQDIGGIEIPWGDDLMHKINRLASFMDVYGESFQRAADTGCLKLHPVPYRVRQINYLNKAA